MLTPLDMTAERILLRVAQIASDAAGLLLPLLVALAGGLSSWVLLEVLRSRRDRAHRARLPGRPPIWAPPPTGGRVARRGSGSPPARAAP
jgi:hypothetical protein